MSGLPEGPTVLFGVLRSQVLWNLLAAEVESTAWMDQEGLQPLSPPNASLPADPLLSLGVWRAPWPEAGIRGKCRVGRHTGGRVR